MKLNQKKIALLKDRGRYGDGRNLFLSVGPTGNKHWLFVYQRNGRQHMIGLGSLRYVTLEEAREQAADYRKLLRQGLEPPRAPRWTGAARARAGRSDDTARRRMQNQRVEVGWQSSTGDDPPT